MPRRAPLRTARKKALILAAVAKGWTVAEAAKCANISRRTLFQWKSEDPEFEAAFRHAYDTGSDCFEREARRRAFKESDILLMFLMKQRDPKRFNTKQVMLAVGGSVDVEHAGDVTMRVEGANEPGRIFILPDNHRGPVPQHMRPPPGYIPPPRTIDVEAEPVTTDETRQPEQSEDTSGWIRRKVT